MDLSTVSKPEHDDSDEAVDIVAIAKHHIGAVRTLSQMQAGIMYILILFSGTKSKRQVRELYTCQEITEDGHTTHTVKRAPIGRYHLAPAQTLINRGWKDGTLADHHCLVEHHTETKPKPQPAWKAKRQRMSAMA